MIRMHTVGPLLRAAGLTADRTAAAVIVAVVLLFAGLGLARADCCIDGTLALNGPNFTVSAPTVRVPTIVAPTDCPTIGLRTIADRFDVIAKNIDKVWPTPRVLKADAAYLRQLARCLREASSQWGIP